MTSWVRLLFATLLAVALPAVAEQLRERRPLMGTVVELTIPGPARAVQARAADLADREMARLTAIMSHYDEHSVVSEIARRAGRAAVPAPPELFPVLRMARAMSEASGGAFDVTVGALRGWRFEPGGGREPSRQEIRQLLRLVDFRDVVLDEPAGTVFLRRPGMRLDLGGIAKLPILHAGMEVLRREGVAHALINAGGDVLAMGTNAGRPWVVGLRHPRKAGALLGTLEVTDAIVATSGDYERYFERDGVRRHHILDPRTGYPVDAPPQQVTLIAPDLERINGLGVAIMVRGPDWARETLARLPGVEALIVGGDGQIWMSHGIVSRYRYRTATP